MNDNATSPLLEELNEQMRKLSDQMRDLKRRIEAERLRIAYSIYRVKVGDVVLYKGIKHRVTDIDVNTMYNNAKPYLVGNPMKKDGSYGTAVRYMYREWSKE